MENGLNIMINKSKNFHYKILKKNALVVRVNNKKMILNLNKILKLIKKG